MNKLLGICLGAVLAAVPVLSEASPRDRHHGHGHHGHSSYYGSGRHNDRHGHRHHRSQRDYGYWDHRSYNRSRHDRSHHRPSGYPYGYAGPQRHHHHRHYNRYRAPSHYHRPHGYYARSWHRGHYLPASYYASNYYVDYRPYDLAPPPYGHHWVRVGSDVLLVALATGLIADAVYGLFY